MGERNSLAEISAYMVEGLSDKQLETLFLGKESIIERVERQIEVVKESLNPDDYTMEEITAFYINIELRHSIWITLAKCHDLMKGADFMNLQKSRF